MAKSGLKSAWSFLGNFVNVFIAEYVVLKGLTTEPETPSSGYFVIWVDDNNIMWYKNSLGERIEVSTIMKAVSTMQFDASNLVADTWVQVVAATTQKLNGIQIFDAAGLSLEWSIEDTPTTALFGSGPGSNEMTPVNIPAGSKISVRAKADEEPSLGYSGRITINFMA